MTTIVDTPSPTQPRVEPAVSSTAAMLPAATARYLWAVTRLCLGWTFLWPFLDKTFGLGHETPWSKAWLNGGSPTNGFLAGATGPFAGLSTTASPVPDGPTGASWSACCASA